jgi:hypothetical protein
MKNASRSHSATTITSRRAYNRLQQQQQNPSSQSTPTNTATASKEVPPADTSGWPDSVRYTGYALACTIGPYSLLWLVANTPVLHDNLIHDESYKNWLRSQFGVPEQEQENTLLRPRSKGNDAAPTLVKKLPLEQPFRIRQLAREQEALNQTLLTVKMTLYSDDSSDTYNSSSSRTVTVQVPASVLARKEQLQDYLASAGTTNSSSSASSSATLASTSIMGLEFLSQRNSEGDEITESTLYPDKPVDKEAATNSPDPLLQQAAVYSTWHHYSNQDVSLAAKNASASTTIADSTSPLAQKSQSLRDDQALKQQLEYEIAKLQEELQGRNHASMRDYDDIQAELQAKKAQLRRLTWKRWVLW